MLNDQKREILNTIFCQKIPPVTITYASKSAIANLHKISEFHTCILISSCSQTVKTEKRLNQTEGIHKHCQDSHKEGVMSKAIFLTL